MIVHLTLQMFLSNRKGWHQVQGGVLKFCTSPQKNFEVNLVTPLPPSMGITEFLVTYLGKLATFLTQGIATASISIEFSVCSQSTISYNSLET